MVAFIVPEVGSPGTTPSNSGEVLPLWEVPSTLVGEEQMASPLGEQKLPEWHFVRLYPIVLELTQLLQRSLGRRWLISSLRVSFNTDL